MPLHPLIAGIIDNARSGAGTFPTQRSIERLRKTFEEQSPLLGPGPDLFKVEDVQGVGRNGHIPLRVYFGSKNPAAVIAYAHGGGWSIGTPDSFDSFARVLAHRSESTVIVIDYALAPEHPFPRALHDVVDAIRWIADPRSALMGAGTPLVLAGDSAGANLAIAAMPLVGGSEAISRLLLLYPVTDSDFSTNTYREHGHGLLFTKEDMEWFFGNYAPKELWSDPRIAVLHADDTTSFPQTFIATAEYDALRDEGEAFGDKLTATGSAVYVQRYPGVTHGFARLHNVVDTADRALDDFALFAKTGAYPSSSGSSTF